jgi:hypothetical protein
MRSLTLALLLALFVSVAVVFAQDDSEAQAATPEAPEANRDGFSKYVPVFF